MDLNYAYAVCERVTAEQARNFSYGIRLLPTPKRMAMCALYAMARRIDDIGDGPGEPAAKLAALGEVRRSLEGLCGATTAGLGEDPVLVALADTAKRYPLPLEAIEEIVEGCEMDVVGTRYATFEELVAYCRRVAGSVGRLSLAVYGTSAPAEAAPLADALGVALQLTNILRDVVEDRDLMGRVYLPEEDRRRFGVDEELCEPREAMVALICFEAGRALQWYERGLELLPMLDWRSRACTAAMAGIYSRLLQQIMKDPAQVLERRVSLGAAGKARVAARALLKGAA